VVFVAISGSRIAAIVLAAGKSERMGRPKALLPLRGRTFLENILRAISHSSIGQTIVVAGHHKEEIEGMVGRDRCVFNPDYEQGMITSIQTGIRALSPEIDGAMLFLVDHPLIDSETIDALIKPLRPGHIVLPVYLGRRGHPVLFSAGILQEILALPSTEGANIVVRKDPSRIIEVSLDTPGILVDIDTPEQFAKLLEEEE
jgi:molybdenum cofactor cytidylyltransferase